MTIDSYFLYNKTMSFCLLAFDRLIYSYDNYLIIFILIIKLSVRLNYYIYIYIYNILRFYSCKISKVSMKPNLWTVVKLRELNLRLMSRVYIG